MPSLLWKPISESDGRLVVLTSPEYNGQINNVQIRSPSGQILSTGNYRGIANQNRGHWRFDRPGGSYPRGSTVILNLRGGGTAEAVINNTAARNENVQFMANGNGERLNPNFGADTPKNSPDDPFIPEGFEGGGSTGVAANPFYLGGLFPQFTPIDFPEIDPAPYNFVDPLEFATQFAELNRDQVGRNFAQAQDMALEALGTELEGLQFYVPAAAALKRSQTSIDNLFNQAQRRRQVEGELPTAREDLEGQRRRALAYAEGRFPDEQTDRAFELGIRSRAADRVGFGGFGPRSSAGEKISDLMSAEERFQLAQYGENLLTNNIGTRANLFLAPTQYSDAGAQVRVSPEVGAGRLSYQGLSEINQATLLPPSAALESTIQQNQFETSLVQRTNEFNATGTFAADQFNSQGSFNAALGKFAYNVSYANALQGASQQNLDFAAGLGLQGIQQQSFVNGFQGAQDSQTISSVVEGLGNLPSLINSAGSILNLPQSPDTGGSTVQGKAVDTTPTQTQVTQSPQQAQPVSVSPAAVSRGVDLASPSALRFAEGVATPQGYTPVASNGDGTYTAANTDSYRNDLERFAKFGGSPAGDISIGNAAIADRALSTGAKLAYLPLPNFRPVGSLSSGARVYSDPAAAASGDLSLGQNSARTSILSLAMLGATDESMLRELAAVGRASSDPSLVNNLDNLLTSQGPEAVAQAITNRLLGKKPDLSTDAGQQVAFGASRLGELWGSLSPGQKSLALSSLAAPVVGEKTGKNISAQTVPGSERSVAGPLKVGDAVTVLNQGRNGFALARNWGQLSAFNKMAVGEGNASSIAAVADQTGMLGFGPQGAAVPITAKDLSAVGAQAAPTLGVGAAVFKNVNDVPRSYQILTTTPDNRVIALPKNLVNTSTIGSGAPSQLAFAKSESVAQGKHPTQKLWKSSRTGGVIRGSVGGSAIVSGMNLMRQSNPSLLGSMAAYSLFELTLDG